MSNLIIIVGRIYKNSKGKKRKVFAHDKDWTVDRWYVEYINEKNIIKRCWETQFVYWVLHT